MGAIANQYKSIAFIRLAAPDGGEGLLEGEEEEAEGEAHQHGARSPVEKGEDECVDGEDAGDGDGVSDEGLGHYVLPHLIVLPRPLLQLQDSPQEVDAVEAGKGQSHQHRPNHRPPSGGGCLIDAVGIILKICADVLHCI